jgi:hypothetical protein
MRKWKIYEWILNGLLFILFFGGIAFAGSVMRSHPFIQVFLLIICCALAFLFYKVPDSFEEATRHKVIRYLFYFNIVISFLCLITYNRETAYIEKYIFGGKVKTDEVLVDADEESPEHYETDYYVKGGDPTDHKIVFYSYILLVFITPYLSFRISQKVPEPPNKKCNSFLENDH